MDTRKIPATELSPRAGGRADARRHPRYFFLRDLWIKSPTCGVQKAHTIDISESGISALLNVEIPLHEFVELQIELPPGSMTIYATVRQHQSFRYGFEFSASKHAHQLIEATCQGLERQELLKARNQ